MFLQASKLMCFSYMPDFCSILFVCLFLFSCCDLSFIHIFIFKLNKVCFVYKMYIFCSTLIFLTCLSYCTAKLKFKHYLQITVAYLRVKFELFNSRVKNTDFFFLSAVLFLIASLSPKLIPNTILSIARLQLGVCRLRV